MSKSVAVFVNATNQFYSTLQASRGRKIDYRKYLEKAVGSDSLYRAFAYGIQNADEARPFITCLKGIGFEPKYRQAELDAQGRMNLGAQECHMEMAMDICRLLDRTDIVVIGSNDPQLIPLIAYVKERGVKCVIFSARVPIDMRRTADLTIDVTDEVFEKKSSPTLVEPVA